MTFDQRSDTVDVLLRLLLHWNKTVEALSRERGKNLEDMFIPFSIPWFSSLFMLKRLIIHLIYIYIYIISINDIYIFVFFLRSHE